MWPEEPVVAKHASPRNDEEAFEYPLQRAVSSRTTNIGGPTFQADQEFQFHGHLLSVLSFLPWCVDIKGVQRKGPTGGLICGEEGVGKGCLRPRYTVEALYYLSRNGEFLVTGHEAAQAGTTAQDSTSV